MYSIELRFRVNALEGELRSARLPGIRTSRREFAQRIVTRARLMAREALLEALDGCERPIPDLDDMVGPSRGQLRCHGTTGDAAAIANTCMGCGRGALVPQQYASSPHQWPSIDRRSETHRVRTRTNLVLDGVCLPARRSRHRGSATSHVTTKYNPATHGGRGKTPSACGA